MSNPVQPSLPTWEELPKASKMQISRQQYRQSEVDEYMGIGIFTGIPFSLAAGVLTASTMVGIGAFFALLFAGYLLGVYQGRKLFLQQERHQGDNNTQHDLRLQTAVADDVLHIAAVDRYGNPYGARSFGVEEEHEAMEYAVELQECVNDAYEEYLARCQEKTLTLQQAEQTVTMINSALRS